MIEFGRRASSSARARRETPKSGGAAALTEWSLPPIDLWLGYPEGQKPSAQARIRHL